MRCYDQILRQPVWTLRRHKTGRIRVAHNIPDIGKRCRQANELQIQPFCSLEKQKLVDEQLEEITSGSIADHVRLIDDNRPILPNGLGLYEVVDDVVRLLDRADDHMLAMSTPTLFLTARSSTHLVSVVASHFDSLPIHFLSPQHGMQLLVLFHDETHVGKHHDGPVGEGVMEQTTPEEDFGNEGLSSRSWCSVREIPSLQYSFRQQTATLPLVERNNPFLLIELHNRWWKTEVGKRNLVVWEGIDAPFWR